MLEINEKQVLVVVDDLVVVAVHVAVDLLLKKKNHHPHLMKILVMNRKAGRGQHRHVAEVHETEAVNQKNRKNPNYPKRMMKNCRNQKAIKARFENIYFFITSVLNQIDFNRNKAKMLKNSFHLNTK